jgi:hypothetical protein
MTQLLLSHGGIRTLPKARVQGELVSTCTVDPAYMMFRGARMSAFLPKQPLAAFPNRSCLPPALRCLLPGPSRPWAWLHLDAQLGLHSALLFIQFPPKGIGTQMQPGSIRDILLTWGHRHLLPNSGKVGHPQLTSLFPVLDPIVPEYWHCRGEW